MLMSWFRSTYEMPTTSFIQISLEKDCVLQNYLCIFLHNELKEVTA